MTTDNTASLPSVKGWTIKQFTHLLENLPSIRKQYGFSVRKLSTAASIHFNTLTRWEHGDVLPDVESIQRVARVFVSEGYKPPEFDNSRTVDQMLSYMRRVSLNVENTRKLKVTFGAIEHWKREGTIPTLKTMIHVEERLNQIESEGAARD